MKKPITKKFKLKFSTSKYDHTAPRAYMEQWDILILTLKRTTNTQATAFVATFRTVIGAGNKFLAPRHLMSAMPSIRHSNPAPVQLPQVW